MTTEERKKYLTIIPKAEIVIRQAIKEENDLIKTCKEDLQGIGFNFVDNPKEFIACRKIIITELKKQLPQKLVFQEKPYPLWECPTCHYQAMRVGEKLNAFHCKNCGQKFTYDLR